MGRPLGEYYENLEDGKVNYVTFDRFGRIDECSEIEADSIKVPVLVAKIEQLNNHIDELEAMINDNILIKTLKLPTDNG
tara:strand:- start:782 stop:1018 length:237 start_codon:yes stop_codon:yes gene_type:complete